MQQLELFTSETAQRVAEKIMVKNPELILDQSKPAYIVKNFQTQVYDDRPGSPYDRGQADCYYGRPARPHYYLGATYTTDRVDEDGMYPDEIAAYMQGFDDQYASGIFKSWG